MYFNVQRGNMFKNVSELIYCILDVSNVLHNFEMRFIIKKQINHILIYKN